MSAPSIHSSASTDFSGKVVPRGRAVKGPLKGSGADKTEAKRAAKDAEVAALVAAAPTSVEAWESLGPRTKTETEIARDARVRELTDALRDRWLAVQRGRALVESNGVQPGYLERFTELHTQRLELRWALEAAIFPHKGRERARLARLCDEEVADALGGVWPGETVQEAMAGVNLTIQEKGETEWLKNACRLAVAAACEQKYGGEE